MTGCVYKIENKINGKVYIGQTVRPNNRKSQHWSDLLNNKHRNTHFQHCYNSLASEFSIDEILEYSIIESCVDCDVLTEREQYYLNFYRNITICYNFGEFVDKPCRGMKYSEETKQRMRKPKSEQAKINMSKAKNNISEETRKKISENSKGNTFRRGKTQSEETKQKLRDINLGKKLSQETKDKMSKARTGRKFSDETKAKIKKSNELNILRQMISPDGALFEFYNIHEFCRTHGLDVSNVSTVLSEKRKIHKGWTKFKK